MKNFYPKAKGRIHPHPSPSSATPPGEALAVLQILPAAILALTAALGSGDKEVLAYLIMRSIGGGEDSGDPRRCGKSGELHARLFGCGCFDCYTAFWSRWDRSPDRELIHQAIEAFEDHLANSERAGGNARGKRRERRVGDGAEKGKRKGKEKEKAGEDNSVEEETGDAIGGEAGKGDREEVVEAAAGDGATDVVVGGGGGERRKGWADVTAIFNSRLWSLWSPGD